MQLETWKQPIQASIREIPNFPKPGILFYDITPLLQNPSAFRLTTTAFEKEFAGKNITKIASMEARGFIFGSVLAQHMQVGFIPIRKKGKLPFQTLSQNYGLEYRENDCVEMHTDAIVPGDNVLIIDDVLATGRTATAAAQLVEKAGGKVEGMGFLIEFTFLSGRKKLEKYPIYSILQYDKG